MCINGPGDIVLDVAKIAKLASAFMVIMYIAVNSCVIVLRKPQYNGTRQATVHPCIRQSKFWHCFGSNPFVPAGFVALFAVLLIVVSGYAVYYFYGSSKVQRSGVLKIYGHRPALFFLYDSKQRNKGRKAVHKKASSGQYSVGANLDGVIATEAHAVVPLFGNERSSELLVEMGAAIAPQKKVQ